MNRDRMLLGFGVALLVAFFASWYVYRQLQRAQPGPKTASHVQVVVATGPLNVGQRLAATDVALLDWPEGMKPQGSFAHKEDCVGRAVTVPLVQNEVILDQELAKPEEGVGLPVTIPAGMRAVSVGVDDVVAVAGFVTPGTVVDVLVTGTATGAGESVPITRTLLEHTRVLAVGQQLQTEGGKPQSAPVVTLLVSPEDGERLTLAASAGRIHLALRNAVDVADVNPPPVYGPSIFLGTAPPVPGARRVVAAKRAPIAPPAPAPWPVQVIRGDRIENQSFPR
jgi:pilus assembly protein CpaB